MSHTHNELLAAISKPLPWDQVEVKVQAITKDKTRALPVLYMDARAATRRLNEVFGLSWSVLMREVVADGKIVGVACTLSVTLPGGIMVQRCNVGELSEGDRRVDEGDDIPKNSLKGAYSDALKRALAQLGCDCLYQVELPWVPYTGNKFAPFEPETLAKIRFIYEKQMGLKVNAEPPKAHATPSKESQIFTEELRSQPPPPKDGPGALGLSVLFTKLQIEPKAALELIMNTTGRKFFTLQDAAKRMSPEDKAAVSAVLTARLKAEETVSLGGEEDGANL